MQKWYSIKVAANETGIPHQTIRRYIDRHGHHLKLKKQHKNISIAHESIDTLDKIRSWYGDNHNADQVDELLANNGIPMTIDYDHEGKQVNVNFPEAVISLQKGLDGQKKFNEKLLLHLQKQDEYMRKQDAQIKEQQRLIEEKILLRDEQLMSVLRDLQETKTQLAASSENKWWKFWK